jgi:branched-chain amino acid transport system ATP-binding protein
MKTLLQLQNIETFYGEIRALKGISLEVMEGEVVTLIGSNGAGKTTTLKSISGLLKPKSGAIYFKDQRIDNLPAHVVSSMGIAHVPEGRKIFPRLTVQENLEMGAFSIKDQKRIKDKMEFVFELFPRLDERRRQKGGTLSGGEQQMLAMGRALMSEPQILLLDEPSMGLAPLLVDHIFNTIRMLNDQGMTILLIEQNALKALKIANRGYVIQTGNIVLSGPSADLLNNPLVQDAYLG